MIIEFCSTTTQGSDKIQNTNHENCSVLYFVFCPTTRNYLTKITTSKKKNKKTVFLAAYKEWPNQFIVRNKKFSGRIRFSYFQILDKTRQKNLRILTGEAASNLFLIGSIRDRPLSILWNLKYFIFFPFAIPISIVEYLECHVKLL